MIRTLALIVRRPDVTRRDFRDHYEDVHAPLALPHMKGLKHYLRNHVAEELNGVEPGFDVMTEFGYARAEDVAHIVGILQSPEGEPILRDELTFMDKERNTFFAIGDPVVVAGGEQAPGGAVKVAALLKSGAEGAFGPLLEAGPLRAVTHEVLGGPHGEPPWDELAFLWYPADALDDERLRAWAPDAKAAALLRVEACQTDL
ncbi:MAG: EthD domain-containing protein [Myxococcota bacterium]